jgi:hypothetical protein
MDTQIFGMSLLDGIKPLDRVDEALLTDIGLQRDGSLIDPERPLRRIAPPPSAWSALGAALVAMARRPLGPRASGRVLGSFRNI